MMEKEKFEISWVSLWRVFFMLLLVAVLILARRALVILFLAIIISSAFDGPVSWLKKKKIPRILGTLLIFIGVLAVLALLLYTLVPVAIFELQQLFQNFKDVNIPILKNLNISQFTGIDKYLGGLGDLANALFSGGVSFFNVLAGIFGNIAMIIATLILSFYMTVNQSGVEKFLKAILPITNEDYIVNLYLRVRKSLGLWLQGQLLLMLVVGGAASLGLWILGVKYGLILGLLAGLLEIVPVVGPIFSGTMAFLIALSSSWTLAFYVIILFIIIQQLENHLLVPLIMKKTVGVNPVVVVISIFAGAQIAGFVGVLLAVPTAVILQEIVFDYEKRKLKNQRLEMGQ